MTKTETMAELLREIAATGDDEWEGVNHYCVGWGWVLRAKAILEQP